MTYQYTECGLENIYLKNGYKIIDDPDYGEITTVINTKGLHKAIGKELALGSSNLSGAEIRFLRTELNLSQKRLANLMGLDAQTIARWEKGSGQIPRSSELVLRGYYLNSFFGDGDFKMLTDKLSSLDAQHHMIKIELEELENKQWQVSNAA